jgi:hypothetical protein
MLETGDQSATAALQGGMAKKTGCFRKTLRVDQILNPNFMEAQKVDMFLMTHGKYFESYLIPQIRDRMLQLEDSKLPLILSNDYKEPAFSLIFSLFGGHYGVDRFVIGDVGLGVLKLLTCGGFLIWTIVDWFIIMGRTREVNYEKLQRSLI